MVEEITYRAAYVEEWEDIMALAWKTFLVFEANEYSKEGVDNFHDFVWDDELRKMFERGVYQVFVALDGNRIVGMISLRNFNHISLLFVDEQYHHRGIGRSLIYCLREYMYREMGQILVTVNSSPYAEGFYHKIGFTDTGARTVADGIIFTPMQFIL